MQHKTPTILGLAFFFLSALTVSAADRPNILFILVDDMGWRDLGCYGNEIHETPNIDKLAADGMRFTDGYAACPVCSPTRASIMAGKFPSRTGITNWLPGDFYNNTPLRPEQHLDGVSLVPLLTGDADFGRGPMIWHYPHYLPRHHAKPGSAIRVGDWKFESFHPAERGPKFAKASGALQVLSYKTEIEAMLRTPSLDGFHLNGLIDYPGEGIALIGMLDAMGDSKGLITPAHFRRFCSETVALAAIAEDELAGGSLFEAVAMVRHHGPNDVDASPWLWSISDNSGKVLFEGDLGNHRVATGGLTELGKIEAKLPNVTEAQELILKLWMADSEMRNEWSFWVFPAEVDVAVPEGVTSANAWNSQIRKALENGGNILLALDESCLVDPVPCRFWTVFWGRGLFPHIPRPMGIYCDPAHPVLGRFPTRGHSQFHWYSLLTGSFAINLNQLPFDFEPVVYMIDDFNECHRLGLLLEAKVGKGCLLISSLNLGKEGQRTLAQRQMLKSLLARAGEGDAEPAQSLTFEQLDKLFVPERPLNLKRIGGTIAEVSSFNPGEEKENMLDGSTKTFWHSRYTGGFAKPPHYVVIQVPEGTSVCGLSYAARSGGNDNGHVKAYAVSVSDDGKTWGAPLMKGALKVNVYRDQEIRFPSPTNNKFIKFEATDAVSLGGQPIAAIGELDVLVEQ